MLNVRLFQESREVGYRYMNYPLLLKAYELIILMVLQLLDENINFPMPSEFEVKVKLFIFTYKFLYQIAPRYIMLSLFAKLLLEMMTSLISRIIISPALIFCKETEVRVRSALYESVKLIFFITQMLKMLVRLRNGMDIADLY